MEYLYNGFTLEFCAGAFPLSTDSMALAHFARLPKDARVLDLGSGCGTLGLLLCAKDSGCRVTGVEICPDAHERALQNSRSNDVSHRLTSICADIKAIPSLLEPGSFDVCISNPPYFTGGFPSQTLPHARQEDLCSLEDLFSSAAWALRYGGDFFLVHKPERLAQLFAAGARHKLEAKRLCLLRHKEGGPVSLVLVQLRKGAKPGLVWEENALHNTDGTPTDHYKALYHITDGPM